MFLLSSQNITYIYICENDGLETIHNFLCSKFLFRLSYETMINTGIGSFTLVVYFYYKIKLNKNQFIPITMEQLYVRTCNCYCPPILYSTIPEITIYSSAKCQCLNTISLVSFAGMTLNKCAVLRIGMSVQGNLAIPCAS